MGTYRIEITAVGGHGHNREVKDGEVIPTPCEHPLHCPDCIAADLITYMKRAYQNVEKAVLIHWPESEHEVRDDLITGVRKGNF